MLPFPITVNVKWNYGHFGAIRTHFIQLVLVYLVFITYEQVN